LLAKKTIVTKNTSIKARGVTRKTIIIVASPDFSSLKIYAANITVKIIKINEVKIMFSTIFSFWRFHSSDLQSNFGKVKKRINIINIINIMNGIQNQSSIKR
jgi:hypothetical protein